MGRLTSEPGSSNQRVGMSHSPLFEGARMTGRHDLTHEEYDELLKPMGEELTPWRAGYPRPSSA